jgi:hypothetical protein
VSGSVTGIFPHPHRMDVRDEWTPDLRARRVVVEAKDIGQ